MTHRRLALLALPLALALTGCGAGLAPQTYQRRNAADATNVNLGALAVRNIMVSPPPGGRTYGKGDEARGTFRVINDQAEPDRLLEATTAAAEQVVLTQAGVPGSVEVPGQGSTEESAAFILRGLTRVLVTGEFVTMTLRFERAGSVEVLVPVAVTGRSQRPGRTGEPGSEEGEPALQGPAGGHSEAGGEAGAEGTGEPGGGEAERGQGEQGSAEAGSVEAEPEASPSPAPAG